MGRSSHIGSIERKKYLYESERKIPSCLIDERNLNVTQYTTCIPHTINMNVRTNDVEIKYKEKKILILEN